MSLPPRLVFQCLPTAPAALVVLLCEHQIVCAQGTRVGIRVLLVLAYRIRLRLADHIHATGHAYVSYGALLFVAWSVSLFVSP